MEVVTDVITLDRRQCLITNNGPDDLFVGEIGTEVDTWYTVVMGDSVSISDRFNNATGVVSDGVSDVGLLYGGTGVFPPAVEGVDVSGFETITDHDLDLAALAASKQPLDSDLTAIAALVTTSYGRALLTLANAAAADWATDAEVASAIAALAATTQPLDSDLTAIAALATTSYGRAVLTLANAAAADWVTKALYDANTILIATTDDTPVALTVAASTVVGRKASGNISAMTASEAAAVLGTNVYGQVETINPQTGTTYTLVAGDAGKMVSLSNAAAITLTLPQDSDATIAIGTYIDGIQLGAGQVTVVAGSGATLRVSGLTAKARAQYARFGVQKILANTWSLFGDLAAT